MIVVLGATGYVGGALIRVLERRRWPFVALTRREHNYTDFAWLVEYLRRQRPAFLIHAAGYTGKPNVDACEAAHADTLQGNTLLPVTVSHACAATGVPWGHVSSGCIYSGAIIGEGDARRVEADLTKPELRALVAEHPEQVHGFRESDEPNFSFRHPPCSFYSGTKALAEEALADDKQVYLWRLRIPFHHVDSSRNYLSKLQRYAKVYDNVNSLSHLDDFAAACIDLYEKRAPFGVYNVTNPGFVTSRQVVELIEKLLRPGKKFEYWTDDREFYQQAAKTPRSNCVLDSSKLLATGVVMRPVQEALIDALSRWQTR
jgi:UDP-glucose 4,6-dehydratase